MVGFQRLQLEGEREIRPILWSRFICCRSSGRGWVWSGFLLAGGLAGGLFASHRSVIAGWGEEPILQQKGGFAEVDSLHEGNEVDDVAAARAATKAIEAVLADGDAERGGVLALVNGAWPGQSVSVLPEGFHELITLQDLEDGHAGFDLLEVHEAIRYLVGFHKRNSLV